MKWWCVGSRWWLLPDGGSGASQWSALLLSQPRQIPWRLSPLGIFWNLLSYVATIWIISRGQRFCCSPCPLVKMDSGRLTISSTNGNLDIYLWKNRSILSIFCLYKILGRICDCLNNFKFASENSTLIGTTTTTTFKSLNPSFLGLSYSEYLDYGIYSLNVYYLNHEYYPVLYYESLNCENPFLNNLCLNYEYCPERHFLNKYMLRINKYRLTLPYFCLNSVLGMIFEHLNKFNYRYIASGHFKDLGTSTTTTYISLNPSFITMFFSGSLDYGKLSMNNLCLNYDYGPKRHPVKYYTLNIYKYNMNSTHFCLNKGLDMLFELLNNYKYLHLAFENSTALDTTTTTSYEPLNPSSLVVLCSGSLDCGNHSLNNVYLIYDYCPEILSLDNYSLYIEKHSMILTSFTHLDK